FFKERHGNIRRPELRADSTLFQPFDVRVNLRLRLVDIKLVQVTVHPAEKLVRQIIVTVDERYFPMQPVGPRAQVRVIGHDIGRQSGHYPKSKSTEKKKPAPERTEGSSFHSPP